MSPPMPMIVLGLVLLTWIGISSAKISAVISVHSSPISPSESLLISKSILILAKRCLLSMSLLELLRSPNPELKIG